MVSWTAGAGMDAVGFSRAVSPDSQLDRRGRMGSRGYVTGRLIGEVVEPGYACLGVCPGTGWHAVGSKSDGCRGYVGCRWK